MVMEAFEGFETRVRYDIVGHSGESKNILFVSEKSPPADSKMRLETIKVRFFIFPLKTIFSSKKWFRLNSVKFQMRESISMRIFSFFSI